MTKPKHPHTLHTATLVDNDGRQHITPELGASAYCGATGIAMAAHDHEIARLCQSCLNRYVRAVLEQRLAGRGL